MRGWKGIAVLAAIWPMAFEAALLANADVVVPTEAGLGPRAVVAKIETSATDCDTSVAELVALARRGVADEVAAMAAADARDGTPAGAPPAAGNVFRDVLSGGGEGPAMVMIPAGWFRMGCLSNDGRCFVNQKPVHQVTIPAAFALSVHEVTFADYDRFTHRDKVDDEGWGRGRRPLVNVSWNAAQDYVAWLSAQTGALPAA